jgi:hypothetical protein
MNEYVVVVGPAKAVAVHRFGTVVARRDIHRGHKFRNPLLLVLVGRIIIIIITTIVISIIIIIISFTFVACPISKGWSR